MKTHESFTRVITASTFFTWLGFFIYYFNATNPHEGGSSFLAGTVLTLIVVWGIFAIKKEKE